MAENLKALRRRLRTIRNTKQITRAMEMVSAAKLRRAQNALFAGRPYASKLTDVLARLSASGTVAHPLLAQRELRQRWLVVVTADRGLAGAFNAQIIKQAEQFLRENPENVALVCIGKKGFDYFRTKKWQIAWAVTDLNARISSQRANEIADRLMESFLNEETDEVLLLYNKFISTLMYRPALETILPLRAISGQLTEAGRTVREYLLEPSPDAVLDALLPRFVRSKIFIMLAETFTAEHSARMVAMSGATRNCEELTDKLTLRLNKVRQAAITKEIIEIVSGAEALKA
ncbi:MAG: ATP synthase F1 subunit gamma [Candidatus Sumerlaea chitinivorans]|nr:ATP synthase F1 subunit gamma [Candidatus Sumerlaea chitinivorans]